MLSLVQSLLWLRHPVFFGGVIIYAVLKLADLLLGEETSAQFKQRAKNTLHLEEKHSQEEPRVCDEDVEEDCASGEDEKNNLLENNNSKNIFTDASPDIPSDDDNTNINDIESVKNAQNETKSQDILRKSSRDAEAQTKSRESRDSFRCRGCGVERNRQRFEEEMQDQEFDRDHINQRSMSDTFKNKKKAATIDSTQLVSVHHYIGKLVQVSASNGVMVGDNNCMHIQNSHSENCLSPEESNVCYQCQRQRMTDDQKSEMATQADFVQTDGPEYTGHSDYEHDGNQSEDDLISQSEEEMLSPGETPPMSPTSPQVKEGDISFDRNTSHDGDSSCEMTFSPLSVGEESCDLCPNCLQNSQQRRLSPPSLSPDIFVEAKLKIFKATKELREHQGRSSRRSRQNESFQRSTPNSSGSNSPVVKSKINVRESVRKILAKRRQSRERQSRERPQNNSISDSNSTFHC